MREARLVNLTRGTVLAERAAVAETAGTRRRGLLGTDSLGDGYGLLIVPCRQVHTFGMRFPIDVVFVDEAWKVKRIVPDMRPGRIGAPVFRARAALELPAGKAVETETQVGDMLDTRDVPAAKALAHAAIDHVNRYVTDVGKHAAFYTEALGYEVIDRGAKEDGSEYAVLKGYGHELFISEKPSGGAAEAGIRHIGYAVADADGLLERLKGSGVAAAGTEIIVKGYSRQFYLHDPDGNEIDFIQWTDKGRFYRDLHREP